MNRLAAIALVLVLAACPKKKDAPAAFAPYDAWITVSGPAMGAGEPQVLFRGDPVQVVGEEPAAVVVRTSGGAELRVAKDRVLGQKGRVEATVLAQTTLYDSGVDGALPNGVMLPPGLLVFAEIPKNGRLCHASLAQGLEGFVAKDDLETDRKEVGVAHAIAQLLWLGGTDAPHAKVEAVAADARARFAGAKLLTFIDPSALDGRKPEAEAQDADTDKPEPAPKPGECGWDPGVKEGKADGEYVEAEDCEPEEFDQNCAPDDCWGPLEECRSTCNSTCTDCKATCRSSCEACSDDCPEGASGDACRAKCVEGCAGCRADCLATRKTCREKDCEADYQSCSKQEDAAWERDCKAPCDEVTACMSRCTGDRSQCRDNCLFNHPLSDRCSRRCSAVSE